MSTCINESLHDTANSKKVNKIKYKKKTIYINLHVINNANIDNYQYSFSDDNYS